MYFRPGRESDFIHLETFVWQAIFPAFDRPGLSAEQRAENDMMVEEARATVMSALGDANQGVFVAWDEQRNVLAGYAVVDASPRAYAEVRQLMVKRGARGRGVADRLMILATEFIGRDRAVQVALRYFNARAIAFFEKHDFQNTGETAGDFAIPRVLLLREAYEDVVPTGLRADPVARSRDQKSEGQPATPPNFDFPSVHDEPVFEPLPDYTLATEELDESTPVPEESSLTDRQLRELETFIQRARKIKRGEVAAERKQSGKYENIPFEIERTTKVEPDKAETTSKEEASVPAFEFAFETLKEELNSTKEASRTAPEEENEEILVLSELKEVDSPDPIQSIADLREQLQESLTERLIAYFGRQRSRAYLQHYSQAKSFHQLRDGSLLSLSRWLQKADRPEKLTKRRVRNTLAELIEFFIVEEAADLHDGAFPQRLLRYQSTDWATVDLFRLVMDYLDFDQEQEAVFTDFVAMPSRALRNATNAYLSAGRDERVFFICDQSVFGSGRHGFAFTDSGVYWKNVLQPVGAATFTTLQDVRVSDGHLLIDGQFFDAGRHLNLKVALLLDKLRRIEL